MGWAVRKCNHGYGRKETDWLVGSRLDLVAPSSYRRSSRNATYHDCHSLRREASIGFESEGFFVLAEWSRYFNRHNNGRRTSSEVQATATRRKSRVLGNV